MYILTITKKHLKKQILSSLNIVNLTGQGVTHLYIEDWLKGTNNLIRL